MTIQEMQQRKRELGLTYEQIAEKSGLSVITVKRIMNGTITTPRPYSLSFIEMALNQYGSVVREGAPAFSYMAKKQGEYTVEDYLALPEEERCELIDGVIYDMASPTINHQQIAGELFFQLKDHIRKNKGTCRAVMAPSDVFLGDNNALQPDVYVVCKPWRKDIDSPAFVAEVISPSTKQRDYIIKLKKYQETNAREYWILDYEKDQITVYLFDSDDISMKTYGFYDRIPVSIWNGACMVDLSPLKEDIPFFDGATNLGEGASEEDFDGLTEI